MLFYGDLNNKSLSQKIAKQVGVKVLYPDVHVFPDGERRVRILEDVVGKKVTVLKSLALPTDSNLIEFVFLVDAIKRSGATHVTALIPYLSYQRADHVFRSGEAVALEVVISMIETAGVDKIVLLEPHSIKISEFFTIPVEEVSSIPLFAQTVRTFGVELSNISIVSPDMGGIRRVKQMSDMLGGVPFVAVSKNRNLESGKVIATHHEGQIREICVIVDDLCSTGHTIVNAVDYLLAHGARKVYVMCTHPVLSGNASILLQDSKVEKVFMTDSIAISDEKRFDKLEVLSVAKLLADSLNKL